MFTGIVTDVGRVRSIERRGDTRIQIATAYDMEGVAIGASICCGGACMTVVAKGPGWFAVDVSGETLSKTTLGDWQTGRRINLERSLKVGDELGGHLVSGHVDGVATVLRVTAMGETTRFDIEAPERFGSKPIGPTVPLTTPSRLRPSSL